MLLNIVTPVSRPNFLPVIYQNICENITKYMECRWYCIPDKHVVQEPLEPYCSWMIVDNDYPLPEKHDVVGNFQRNVALEKFQEGWIYFLDDDNIFHPDFAPTILEAVQTHTHAKAIILSQLYNDGVLRVTAADKPELYCVDTGSFIIKREIIDKYPCGHYHSDFLLLEGCYKRHPEAFVGVNKAVTYHNFLLETIWDDAK